MMGTKKNILLLTTLSFFTLSVAGAIKVDARKNPPTAGMVKIAGGEYTMFFDNQGSRKVKIKPFYLDARAVTNAEYLEFVKANPKWARSKVSKLFADAGYLSLISGAFPTYSHSDSVGRRLPFHLL